jgi:hypothetical protein
MDFLYLGESCTTTPENTICFTGWAKEPSGINSFRPMIKAQFFSVGKDTLLIMDFCPHVSVKIFHTICLCVLLSMQIGMLITIPVLQAVVFLPTYLLLATLLFYECGKKSTATYVQKMILSEFRENGIAITKV